MDKNSKKQFALYDSDTSVTSGTRLLDSILQMRQLESPCDTGEDSVKATVKSLEHCCTDIKTWVLENRLKLNDDKTEVLLCRPSSLQKAALIEHILVGELQINLSDSVRDLGLVIDANLDMTTHIRSLGKLWPFLTQDAAKCHCGVSRHVQAGPL